MPNERKRWKKNGLVYYGRHGYVRGFIAREGLENWTLVGPLGTGGRVQERNFVDLEYAKKTIEKELRDAGY